MKRLTLLLTTLLIIGFTAAQTSTQIEVNLKKTEPVPVQSSEYADIWLEVTNEGGTAANNVQLEFLQNYPFSVDPDEQTEWDLGELVPGEEYQIHLQARVDENAVQGSNILKFETTTSSGTSITHDVPIEVRTDNAILSIQNTDFPETVAPGSTNTMTLVMRNMADSQLKNIQIELDTSSDSLPMATSGSATANVEKIESGDTTNVTFRLSTDESAENGVYKLPVNIEYENEAGTLFTKDTTTGIVVGGTPQLELGINNDEQITEGRQTVTFRVVNRGYGSAEFVELSVPDGDNYRILSQKSVYIGDMDSDDFQTAEFEMFLESTNVTVPATLTYRDQSGEVTETEQINLDVYSQSELQQYGLTPQSNLLPVAAVVIVLVVGVLYWRRRRKEK